MVLAVDFLVVLDLLVDEDFFLVDFFLSSALSLDFALSLDAVFLLSLDLLVDLDLTVGLVFSSFVSFLALTFLAFEDEESLAAVFLDDDFFVSFALAAPPFGLARQCAFTFVPFLVL